MKTIKYLGQQCEVIEGRHSDMFELATTDILAVHKGLWGSVGIIDIRVNFFKQLDDVEVKYNSIYLTPNELKLINGIANG